MPREVKLTSDAPSTENTDWEKVNPRDLMTQRRSYEGVDVRTEGFLVPDGGALDVDGAGFWFYPTSDADGPYMPAVVPGDGSQLQGSARMEGRVVRDDDQYVFEIGRVL